MGAPGLKPRIRSAVPRTVWNAFRRAYWSGAANFARRIVAAATAAHRTDDLADVETILLFIGYPRSGHSLVGSLLSAHPDVVVAHELHALWYWERGFSLRQLLGLILRRDRWFQRHNRQWTEYNYSVPGQWQGRYRTLRVVGDKKGDGVTDLTHRYPGLLGEFISRAGAAGVRVKIVHTVRNPFDNIATMQRRTGDPLSYVIERHRKRLAVNASIIEAMPKETVYTVRHEDLIAEPRATLGRLLDHIGVERSEEYLHACESILFTSPHKSRKTVRWNADEREAVERMIDRTTFLSGYSFDD